MGNYFILDCHPGLKADHYWLRADEVANRLRWFTGNLFSSNNQDIAFQPPACVIEIETQVDDEEDRVYPVLTWEPVPLMKRSLVRAFQDAGVDNMQAYPTRLTNPQGSPPVPEDFYLAVNIVGKIAAANMGISIVPPENEDEMIAVDFNSLSLDEQKTHNLQMFRLAENISAVLVHKRIRDEVEAKGIDDLTWFEPEEWAG